MFGWLRKKGEKFSNLGAYGEDLAAEYLKKKGYAIKERNFKNDSGRRMGEIDLIAEKDGQLVFVEVKTREITKNHRALPEENINFNKLRRLNRIAQFYIRSLNLWNKPFRFDGIAISVDRESGEKEIRHLESIFL